MAVSLILSSWWPSTLKPPPPEPFAGSSNQAYNLQLARNIAGTVVTSSTTDQDQVAKETSSTSLSHFEMVPGGCCSLVVVPLLAVFVGTGLVKVDVTPLCAALGALLPKYVPKTTDGKPLVIPNKEIRRFLETYGMKGPMATRPESEQPSLRGVYMFDQMGPAGWIDFSYLTKWDPSTGAMDTNIYDITAQSGVPAPRFGGIGPFMPGGYLIAGAEKMQSTMRFYCPVHVRDGDRCLIVGSSSGNPFPDRDEAGRTHFRMMLKQVDGGRKYTRDTWIVPPWAVADDAYAESHETFHTYNLLRLMHANRSIDEEHFSLFMEKFDGQDLVLLLSLSGSL